MANIRMEKITSRENKTVKEFKKLSSSRSFRQEKGLFVIESCKLVWEAVESGVSVEKVFVTPRGLEKNDAVLQKLFERGNTFFYEITDEIEDKLSQTGNAQGIFAVCKKLDKQNDIGKIKEDGKYIYLSRLQDTGNVGTILRTAEAMGISGVILSKDTCDYYSLKVLRASMGSAFRIPVYESTDEVQDLQKLGERFETYAAVLASDAQQITQVQFPKNSITVIGNEGNGLAPQVIEACRHRITIPMKGNAESLNAGMAAGILMWEMMR